MAEQREKENQQISTETFLNVFFYCFELLLVELIALYCQFKYVSEILECGQMLLCVNYKHVVKLLSKTEYRVKTRSH